MSKLFIYIPTFNRPKTLKIQLEALLPQIEMFPNNVRVIVNDNCSEEALDEDFVQRISKLENLTFHKNHGNIGGNANIALGFIMAQEEEFIWILSDNDIVRDNAVEYLLSHLSDEIDFFCFNGTVEEATLVDHSWEKGWQIPMDWRMGLISDALYNSATIKGAVEDAFYYHNSSFPHLAVGCSAAKQKGDVKFMLLPRKNISLNLLSLDEFPTDYSLAHIGMPHLIPLFPEWEAREFAIKWAKKHGVDFYKFRFKHPFLFEQSRSVLIEKGGGAARGILIYSWILHKLSPITSFFWKLRLEIVAFLKRKLSSQNIEKLKNVRNFFCRK